jgi:hypothetical protein
MNYNHGWTTGHSEVNLNALCPICYPTAASLPTQGYLSQLGGQMSLDLGPILARLDRIERLLEALSNERVAR